MSTQQKILKNDEIYIGIANTITEKEKIFNFRYKIYIKEMSKQIAGVDHDKQILKDELDEWAILLYAKVNSKIVATIRVNVGDEKKYGSKLSNILSFKNFKNHNKEMFGFVTKLMIDIPYRNSSILYSFMIASYKICYENNVKVFFGACNFHLLRLYEQMGFRRYTNNFIDPGYGLLAPIAIVVHDLEHLRKVRSPFLRAARKLVKPEQEYSSQSLKSPTLNSQITSAEDIWKLVSNTIAIGETSILYGLSETEIKFFLYHCGIHVKCDNGDIFVFQGDLSYSYNILLSGSLESLTISSPKKRYSIPGIQIGAQGLVGHDVNMEDIISVGESELFILSGLSFPRFVKNYQDIAYKIIANLNIK